MADRPLESIELAFAKEHCFDMALDGPISMELHPVSKAINLKKQEGDLFTYLAGYMLRLIEENEDEFEVYWRLCQTEDDFLLPMTKHNPMVRFYLGPHPSFGGYFLTLTRIYFDKGQLMAIGGSYPLNDDYEVPGSITNYFQHIFEDAVNSVFSQVECAEDDVQLDDPLTSLLYDFFYGRQITGNTQVSRLNRNLVEQIKFIQPYARA